jgi:nucleotide-binding universal stress UspA family protein
MFHRILVGLDGSDGSRRAFDRALELAQLTGAAVHVLSVEEHLPAFAGTVGEVEDAQRFANQYFRGIHEEASALASRHGRALTHEIVPGHAAQTIARRAREGDFDLIILGHAGHSPLHNLFLGSTADRVVEHASCAVLVVR